MTAEENLADNNRHGGFEMRIILVLLAMVIYFIITLPIYLILLLIGIWKPRWKAKLSQKMIAFAFRLIFVCSGTKLEALGLENIPKDEAILYVSNHRGFADIPSGYISLPTITGFIAKKEIAKIPFLSWWMRNVNCLFLDRKDLKKGLKTILKGVDLMKQGYSMFIMPEGTRNGGEELLPFKEGSFKIAEKSGSPIVPVAITNSDAVYEKQKPWVKSTHVIIRYGKPIYLEHLSKDQRKMLGSLVRNIISDMLVEDKKLLHG